MDLYLLAELKTISLKVNTHIHKHTSSSVYLFRLPSSSINPRCGSKHRRVPLHRPQAGRRTGRLGGHAPMHNGTVEKYRGRSVVQQLKTKR